MIHVNSTQRAKRVARDLQGALSDAGRPMRYSACLEMSAKMLGHPNYGMLTRSAGHAVPASDDDLSSPAEVSARRALHVAVLAHAGVPGELHDEILRKARPTRRSRTRSRPVPLASAYGCAWFDDNDSPGAGWACIAGGEPHRFSYPSDLSGDITWWTNLRPYYLDPEGPLPGNMLYDRHLGHSPKGSLMEHGLDLSGAEAARAAASIGAEVMTRAKGILPTCLTRSHSRGLITALAMEWKGGHGSGAADVSKYSAWTDFLATAIRSPRGGINETFVLPRLAYARAMMDVLVPIGPYETLSLGRGSSQAIRMGIVEAMPDVAFVQARPLATTRDECPIRGAFWYPGHGYDWYPKAMFDFLKDVAGLSPIAVMLAPESRKARRFLPPAAAEFLANADETSWADGIVAEAIWRSGLTSSKTDPGSWQASLAAVYLRRVDQMRMYGEAKRFHAEGYAVSSFGLGWVRYWRPAAPSR